MDKVGPVEKSYMECGVFSAALHIGKALKSTTAGLDWKTETCRELA